jgi:hypothetical protein
MNCIRFDYSGEYKGIRDENAVANFEDYFTSVELNKSTKFLRMTRASRDPNCKPASTVWESNAQNKLAKAVIPMTCI